MNDATSPLLTDLYQLNMIQAYLDQGKTDTAVFELFFRRLPARRGFLLASGLEQVLTFLEDLRFSAEEIDWLAQSPSVRHAIAGFPSCASARARLFKAMIRWQRYDRRVSPSPRNRRDR